MASSTEQQSLVDKSTKNRPNPIRIDINKPSIISSAVDTLSNMLISSPKTNEPLEGKSESLLNIITSPDAITPNKRISKSNENIGSISKSNDSNDDDMADQKNCCDKYCAQRDTWRHNFCIGLLYPWTVITSIWWLFMIVIALKHFMLWLLLIKAGPGAFSGSGVLFNIFCWIVIVTFAFWITFNVVEFFRGQSEERVKALIAAAAAPSETGFGWTLSVGYRVGYRPTRRTFFEWAFAGALITVMILEGKLIWTYEDVWEFWFYRVPYGASEKAFHIVVIQEALDGNIILNSEDNGPPYYQETLMLQNRWRKNCEIWSGSLVDYDFLSMEPHHTYEILPKYKLVLNTTTNKTKEIPIKRDVSVDLTLNGVRMHMYNNITGFRIGVHTHCNHFLGGYTPITLDLWIVTEFANSNDIDKMKNSRNLLMTGNKINNCCNSGNRQMFMYAVCCIMIVLYVDFGKMLAYYTLYGVIKRLLIQKYE